MRCPHTGGGRKDKTGAPAAAGYPPALHEAGQDPGGRPLLQRCLQGHVRSRDQGGQGRRRRTGGIGGRGGG